MITKTNRIPILRYGLIVTLIGILFFGAFSLYLHYHRTRNLQFNITRLISASENSTLIDSCLLNMYKADNSSRLYALTGNKTYLEDFSEQIGSVSQVLEKMKVEHVGSSALSPDKLRDLINKKAVMTGNYIQLRQLTDSLIRSTIKMDSSLAFTRIKIPIPVTKTVKRVVHYDTIKVTDTTPVTRKKFVGRVFASIFTSKKKRQQQAAAAEHLVVKSDTATQTTVKAKSIYAHIPKQARSYYHRLYNVNNSLKANEQNIININTSLITQMITALKQYKNSEMAYARDSKQVLAGNMTDMFREYSTLSRLTVISLVALIIIVFYNIWKIFDNERELIAYTEKTEEYATLKSRFMASMSHEIRTPLNSVVGFSEQLSMSPLNPTQTEQVQAIRNSSHMLLEVVNEILDFSKYETGRMNFEHQPFIPYQALEEVFNSVIPSADKKSIKLKRSFLIDRDICLMGDVVRFKQVVTNLMVNALKFTARGEVMLQGMLMHTKDDKVVLRVRVKDTGIGISKQNLPLIFEEFAQVTDAQKVTNHKGTGLGLAICKKIVELQGGSIRAISELGKGSVFSFELPFEVSEEGIIEHIPVMSSAELAEEVRNRYVLLVDDNQLNVLLARTILKKWNIDCDVAYNGQEAHELFLKNEYDLVLTDIQMPVMGGLELTQLIRNNTNMLKAETPIIALTANVLKEDRDHYLKTGVNDMVLKPFVERDLVEKVAGVLRIKSGHSGPELLRYG